MKRTPRYAFAIAIFLGLLAAFAPANLPLESASFTALVLISTAIFGLTGLLLGALWPGGGWSWGMWIVAPGFLLVTIGVVTSGEFASFLGDDLPFLVTGLLGAGLGGGLGSSAQGTDRARGIGRRPQGKTPPGQHFSAGYANTTSIHISHKLATGILFVFLEIVGELIVIPSLA